MLSPINRETGVAELIERVEKATGPDRELDAAVWLYFTPGATRRTTRVRHQRTGHEWDINETREADGRLVEVPEFTTSLDAALALVERVLPGWNASAILLHEAPCEGHVWEPGHVGSFQGKAPTPALALILALLKALQSKGDRDAAE